MIDPIKRAPQKAALRLALIAAGCAMIAGCSAQKLTPVASAEPAPVPAVPVASSGGVTKPYVVAGKTYVPIKARKPGKVGVGLASWYGDGFQGRRTANGETFDMAGFTAAHPTLPLPCYARVTNVTNGRSIVVRVNDRGPFHKGRLIDVSRRTADALGFRGAGVGNVKVDYIAMAPAGGRDDRKLLATYQEFGRPSAPEGVQVAALKPVTDAELAGEAGVAGETLVASAAPATVARATVQTHVAPAPAPIAVASVASQPKAAASVEPELASVGLTKPMTPAKTVPAAVASVSKPAPVAVAAREPAAREVVAAAKPSKRVVKMAEPVLASSTPDFGKQPKAQPTAETVAEAPSGAAVASRISSAFDSFGGSNAFAQADGQGDPGATASAYSAFR
ncbi:septal ring lytic transglycosylase RlpA family protein [Hansschlegelia plantiphila]|uniref:Endolytic peptidoglycan transglycosylase RlpA n=1 Tax=Hansschlegelia plantiphila TaxID=374655 RepID=A0A9W6IYP2_9HYPH|nr:septal ring lytic transglycosylase RlpA family protein [Hansschlegelia plantiphila]GLK67472.1 hypothetical protein GCM10008179_11100 [Hansschlegelia plantiphila]